MEHFVEVLYFKNGQYSKRSEELPFIPRLALETYQKAINKFKESGQQAIIVLRDENRFVKKSDRINF